MQYNKNTYVTYKKENDKNSKNKIENKRRQKRYYNDPYQIKLKEDKYKRVV